ncbi:hypothetical protein [Bacillus sp. OTC-L18]|uniref:hypothetical protein n=1 Tax=Bacillus sp. OTC-L18 TaxID=3342792 RepID=UPI0035B7499B
MPFPNPIPNPIPNRRPCEILGTCDVPNPFAGLDPKAMSANDIYNKMEEQINHLVADTTNDLIGEEGKELLKKIEEAKEKLKQLSNPDEMIKEWKKAILHEAEETIIAYLENETRAYEIENIYQLAPLVALDLKNTIVNVEIHLYVSRPDKDTSSIRQGHLLDDISFAVLRARFNYDISQPYNFKQIEDAIKSVRFEILQDSIRERLTEEFEKQQQDLIIQLVPNYFSKYFEVFKQIQAATKVFDF